MSNRVLKLIDAKRIIAVTVAAVLAATVVAAVPVYAEDTEAVEGNGTLAVDPINSMDMCEAILYDNASGLPTSEANAIAQTSDGAIWIGSYGGLIRYDGNNFLRIDSTTGITSVVALFVDSRDRIWIGTNDNGVILLDRDKTIHFALNEGLASLTVRSFAEDKAGNIYVATALGLNYIDQYMTVNPVTDDRVGEVYIRSLCTDNDGVVYCLTMDNTVFTVENNKVSGFYELYKWGINGARALYTDKDNKGFLYIGGEDPVIYYGNFTAGFKADDQIDTKTLTYINDIEFLDGQLWICSDNGIGAMNDKGKIDVLKEIPLNNSIGHIMMDYQGNLWFTSSRQGIMKIVPNHFLNLFDHYNLPEKVVNTTCYYHNRLFIGKDDGLWVMNSKGLEHYMPLESARTAGGEVIDINNLIALVGSNKVRSIIKDSKDNIWISTYGDIGLICYDGKNAVCYTTKDGIPSDRIRTVCERQDGSMIVACTGGVVIIKDGKVTQKYDETNGLHNTEILTVVEAANGDILIGTDGDGIYIINDSGIKHIGVSDGMSSGVVMRIKRDKTSDVLWLVTSNSLTYLDKDYNINTIHKFPYSNNFDIYENDKGNMWILSSNGIYMVAKDELLENGEIDYAYFSRFNGLSSIATANSYSELTESGDLYISGTTGVTKININDPYKYSTNLKMSVSYIDADGVKIYPAEDGSFTVPADVKRLTIYSYVYNYSLVNPKISYHLKGFDSETVSTDGRSLTEINYTNLKGGRYTFIMNLKDPAGTYEGEMQVKIIKLEAFYEQTWFYVVCGIALLAVILLIINAYVKRRIKKFKMEEFRDKKLIREIAEAFAKTIDMKDNYTRGHSSRVADYTVMLAKELGYDDEACETFYNIALLHDVGKIGIPIDVLNKPGKLDDKEFETIKSHAKLGYDALKGISIMPELADGAGCHHERPDGKGYPRGLKGDEIPRVAQIIAVADCFDAMYSDRPYRKRMDFNKAVSIITEVSGTQLTPDVVEAFLRLVEKGEMKDGPKPYISKYQELE